MTIARLAPACAAAVFALALAAPSAFAGANANNYDCGGHVEAGPPQPGDDDTQVQYVFACGGPITGYQIQPQIGDTSFSTDVSVFDQQNNPVTTDSFTCNGDFPGWGINCVGKYTGDRYAKVVGTFAIATPLCAEPRVDPLLTVTYATADSKGVITQYISGPFDLGRPHGCKPSASSGQSRLAAPKPAAEPKATAKKKTTAKKKAKSNKKPVKTA